MCWYTVNTLQYRDSDLFITATRHSGPNGLPVCLAVVRTGVRIQLWPSVWSLPFSQRFPGLSSHIPTMCACVDVSVNACLSWSVLRLTGNQFRMLQFESAPVHHLRCTDDCHNLITFLCHIVQLSINSYTHINLRLGIFCPLAQLHRWMWSEPNSCANMLGTFHTCVLHTCLTCTDRACVCLLVLLTRIGLLCAWRPCLSALLCMDRHASLVLFFAYLLNVIRAIMLSRTLESSCTRQQCLLELLRMAGTADCIYSLICATLKPGKSKDNTCVLWPTPSSRVTSGNISCLLLGGSRSIHLWKDWTIILSFF